MHFKTTLLLLLLLNTVKAETWKINRDHSQLFFTIPYLGISSVTGQFKRFSGSVDLKENIIKHIKTQIDIASIDTSNNMRDGHLRSKDFFNVNKFPNMIFKSKNIKQKNKNIFIATGDLSIKGITQPVTVELKNLGVQKDSWNKESLLIEFKSKVNRKDFGITWNKNIQGGDLLVGNKVSIKGILQLQPKGAKTQSSKYMIPITERSKLVNKVSIGEVSQEDFNKRVKDQNASIVIKDKAPKIVSQQSKNQFTDTNTIQEKTTLWWIAFILMSFFSFIGGILGVITIKKMFIKKYQENYEETGFWGYFSDIYILAFLFIYSWAQWYIGWGN